MSQTTETQEKMSNMKRLKEEASACGPGCGCHAGGAAGRTRWVVGAVILVIAGVLVVRAVTRPDSTSTGNSTSAFAAPTVAGDATAAETNMPTIEDVTAAEAQVPKPEVSEASTTDASAGTVSMPSATDSVPSASADAETKTPESKAVVCGESIGSLSDLNQKAMDKAGVFVLLAGKDNTKARAVAMVVEKTAETIRKRDMKIGLFTIEDGSPEYANLAKQVPPPGVIAMVKGRGTSAVSGDITESKLMQAFVAASSGGGCGSGGCGSGGCR